MPGKKEPAIAWERMTAMQCLSALSSLLWIMQMDTRHGAPSYKQLQRQLDNAQRGVARLKQLQGIQLELG